MTETIISISQKNNCELADAFQAMPKGFRNMIIAAVATEISKIKRLTQQNTENKTESEHSDLNAAVEFLLILSLLSLLPPSTNTGNDRAVFDDNGQS